MAEEMRYFLTVEFCKNGRRGVFCSKGGNTLSKDEAHSMEEMQDFLGPFWLLLDPWSQPMTKAKLKRHSRFLPLAEYSYEYGIALVDDVEDDDDLRELMTKSNWPKEDVITIYAATERAKAWARQEAPLFGEFMEHKWDKDKLPWEVDLELSPCYDKAEVVAHLESFNDQ